MRKNKVNIVFFLIILAFYACEEEKKEPGIIAKVNDSVLTENDLDNMINSERYSNKYKSELVREWIQKEVLFSEAVESGVLQSDDYMRLVEMTNKQVAISLLLREMYGSYKIDVDEDVLKEYYNQYLLDFKISDDAFVFNKICFNDENTAIKFRNEIFVNGWETATDHYKSNSEMVELDEELFKYSHQLFPTQFSRSIKNIPPGEVSIVLNMEPGKYAIVQMINKFSRGETPEFEFIKNVVAERYKLAKQKQIYNEYYNSVYSKYNVEINKEYE